MTLFLSSTLRCTASLTILLFAVSVANSEPAASFANAQDSPDGIAWFEREVRPVLIKHCYECHSAEQGVSEANLELDSQAGLRRGGERGRSIEPGAPDKSLIVRALQHDGVEMPPDQKLEPDVIAAIAKWIEMGAPSPDDKAVVASATDDIPTIDWTDVKQQWAFRTPQAVALPQVDAADWPVREHDFFVLHQLEQRDWSPAPQANRAALVRRLAFDLTGLPPTASQRSKYAASDGPLSEEELTQLVDELLTSPHFGERWARLWLDLARYAEDQAHIVGNDKALFYPNAYLYRDWLIRAFNDDLPYDKFVRLQLAADLIEGSPAEELAALGFLGLGPKYYDRSRLAVKAEEWEDRVDTVSRTILGLTVACARCHDHKYDPITTQDYYAMASVFASTEMHNRPLNDKVETKGVHAKNPDEALHVVRDGKPQDLHVFIRGNVEAKGAASHRGYLTVLSPEDTPLRFDAGSGRLQLAEQLTSADNPLTARVFVNRVWGELFGQPIVPTTSNFGQLGQQASHPDLLDNLSVQFVAQGWSVKWLVRELVTSATYRQSAIGTPAAAIADPENVLLSHMNRKRLSIEAWRDAMLVAANQLDQKVGGASIDPTDIQARRRTLYSSISRFELNPLLAAFDYPDPNVHAARRSETITPQQRLIALNHPLMVDRAEAIAARFDSIESVRERVAQVYLALLGRRPSEEELRLADDFIGTDAQAWRQHVHALMASNEMLFLD